ncbi:MAG: ABC transporter substrate-binding protein [Pseudomonadota bacterium]
MNWTLPQIVACAASLLVSAPAFADKACEAFLESTLEDSFEEGLSPPPSTPSESSNITRLIDNHVDINAIAKFTFGKYHKQVTQRDFRAYERALLQHFSKVVSENLTGSHDVSAEVLSSFDRSNRDCIVESVIHREGREDLDILWRIIRRDDEHHIVDIALKDRGNQIWLSIELRAQVMAVYERSNGNVGAIIQELGLS